MKKLNFKTSKGKFVVVDIESDKDIYDIQSNFGYLLKDFCDWIYLKDITEKQASEIVEEYFSTTTNEIDVYFDYRDDTQTDCPIDSLHSIIEFLGYHLFENPNKDPGLMPSTELDVYRKAQAKTFFNPIIFKLA